MSYRVTTASERIVVTDIRLIYRIACHLFVRNNPFCAQFTLFEKSSLKYSDCVPIEIVQVTSFVRGYHVYLEVWEPKIGDEHCLKREPNNKEDDNAVAVVRKRQALL